MDAHGQIQDEFIRAIKADVMSAAVTELLGVPVKGVLKLVDRPLAAEDTPVVIVEVGAEDVETDDGETPPDRIQQRTLQIVLIVSVNASLKSFARVTRLLSERVRAVVANFRRFEVHFVDARVVSVSPEDFPSESGRQAGHALHCNVVFWSRESAPGTILKLRS